MQTSRYECVNENCVLISQPKHVVVTQKILNKIILSTQNTMCIFELIDKKIIASLPSNCFLT